MICLFCEKELLGNKVYKNCENCKYKVFHNFIEKHLNENNYLILDNFSNLYIETLDNGYHAEATKTLHIKNNALINDFVSCSNPDILKIYLTFS